MDKQFGGHLPKETLKNLQRATVESQEPSAMGPVQFRRPRGVAENWFTKPGFGEHSVDFSLEKQQNTEFTKFCSVRTPEIY